MIERLGADAFGTGPAPLDAHTDGHHELMLRVLVNTVFEGRIEILKSIRSRCRRIGWTEEGIGRAKRHGEILGDPFGKLGGHIALPHGRNVAGLEAVNSGKRQLVVDAGIIDAERCRKEAIADDFVGEASTEGNERYREPWQARAPNTDRHENSP